MGVILVLSLFALTLKTGQKYVVASLTLFSSVGDRKKEALG